MRAIITPEDLKSTDLAEPGWYPAEIVDYKESEADTDGSTNCIFSFKVIDGPSSGIIARKLLNEKGLKYNKSLWKALNFPFDFVRGYELSTQLFEQTVGTKIKIYMKRGKSNKGNEFNDIVDFQSL